MNASLREIVLAVRFGEASLVGESVGYLVLGACDRALAVPRAVDLDAVLVTSEGEVVLDANPVTEADAERSLRYLLAQLLTLLRTPFPNLARVAAREPCGLRHLVTELEAALVPVNRRAARRTLARLVRDARRSLADEHRQIAVTDAAPPPSEQVVLAHSYVQPHVPPFQPAQMTEPAPPDPEPEVDEVPSLLFEPVTLLPTRVRAALAPTIPALDSIAPEESEASGAEESRERMTLPAPTRPSLAPFEDSGEHDLDAAVDDAFDHALTRVAGAVETLPPPETRPRSSFNLRRLVPAPEVEGPLIPSSIPSAGRPSSIEELLLRMRPEGEPDELVLASLAQLARVDVSPLAPPVG